MRRQLLLLALLLGACAPATPLVAPDFTATRSFVTTASVSDLPAMKSFDLPAAEAPVVSNKDLAQDFIDLSFALESGRDLPVFTRFEGPITVRATGAIPPSMGPDLARLLARLRREAGIRISRTDAAYADITIEAVSRGDIRRALPSAACFVVPNIRSLAEYRTAKRTGGTSWTQLRTRDSLAIFVPNDVSPQEMRDCLHEELAQAIGPLNDLYRLPDLVFNDDNVHTVLTGFDMLVLRITYDPMLRSGMTRDEVERVLPGILARLNPRGETLSAKRATPTPRAWSDAIQTALGPGATNHQRRLASQRALSIASDMGWQDHRRAFTHYAAGRVAQPQDAQRAKSHFLMADAIYARSPEARLHRAHVATQLAAYALSEADGAAALRILDPHTDIARQGENAALLSTIMLMQAEALELDGQIRQARRLRLDSLGWARYGFGPDWAVRAKQRDITALNPLKGNG